jgi:membrane associated rhomboid family serine protease
MSHGTEGVLEIFGMVAAGCVIFGLIRGYALGESLAAAAMLGGFVVGIGWVAKRADARLKRK